MEELEKTSMCSSLSRETRVQIEKTINRLIYPFLLLVQFAIGFRFYLGIDSFYYSKADFYFQIFLVIVMDSLIMTCLYKASNSDQGKLPKNAEMKHDFSEDVSYTVCKKCSAIRTNPTIHHCSRCDACIDMMDHHCFFIASCIGKKNIKYFVQFCIYSSLYYGYGVLKLLSLFYTQNIVRDIGVRGIGYLFLPTPIAALRVFYWSVDNGGYSWIHTYDNFLFLVLKLFLLEVDFFHLQSYLCLHLFQCRLLYFYWRQPNPSRPKKCYSVHPTNLHLCRRLVKRSVSAVIHLDFLYFCFLLDFFSARIFDP